MMEHNLATGDRLHLLSGLQFLLLRGNKPLDVVFAQRTLQPFSIVFNAPKGFSECSRQQRSKIEFFALLLAQHWRKDWSVLVMHAPPSR